MNSLKVVEMRRPHRRVQSGLSLVELMVALAIGLFLVLGTSTVFVNTRKNADVDDATARLQDVARYAISVIENDARMANYWGLGKDATSIINKPTQTGSNVPTLIASTAAVNCGALHAVDVETYAAASNNGYALPTTCAANTTAVGTSDVLTIRRASTTTAALSTNQLQICASRTAAKIILNNACTDQIHNLMTNTYYVDQQSTQSAAIPSLRRKSLGAGPGFNDQEIISGVEDMQVQFGWDAGTTVPGQFNGAAVQYVNPGNAVLALTTGQIVAIRVWLLVRTDVADPAYLDRQSYQYADRPTYTPNDNFRRLLVSRTFFIRNAVGT